ncbi:DUF599 domain-containing protein [Marinifaba aquimaris]|uniref:DUF599 domain-containing protein n=1 Tax=Marinifaba aquimaris TaxID=2741323 RepID=UPI0031B5C60C
MNTLTWFDASAFLVALLLWFGYSWFAKRMAKKDTSLSSVLVIYRIDWMRHLLERENRMLDAALMGNLERNINFFASTSLLAIAGAFTGITTAENLLAFTQAVPFSYPQTVEAIKIKFFVISAILVFAFFKFTWALRQSGFVSAMVGAAPNFDDKNATTSMKRAFARNAGKLLDQAGHNQNDGLRAYYFALATLSWLIHPLFYILCSLVVVRVLYIREFKSRTLDMLSRGLSSSAYYMEKQQELEKAREAHHRDSKS